MNGTGAGIQHNVVAENCRNIRQTTLGTFFTVPVIANADTRFQPDLSRDGPAVDLRHQNRIAMEIAHC